LTASTLPPCLYGAGDSYHPLFDDVQDRLGYVAGRWAFWRCRQCGSATLSPFPKLTELAYFYPPIYSFSLDLGKEGAVKRLMARMEYRFYVQPQYEAQVRRVLRGINWGGQSGQRLLDVGCGRGLRLLTFQKRGFEVQGMDFQPKVVEYLQTQLGIPAICTDVDGLSRCFPPAAFDVITAFHVLEHVPDVATTLRTCFQLLKPGGYFVGTAPFMDSVQADLFRARWMSVTEAPRHLSLPSQKGMKRACSQAGFEQVTIRPDSVLTCAGMAGLSVLPGAATTHSYGDRRLQTLLTRLLAGALAMFFVPWCLVDNYLLRRPALGIVFAFKPTQ
jgi:SAM-dependent methyltransferase